MLMAANPENPITLTRDGGMVVYPTQQEDADGSSIRIPQVDTSLGADFGEVITDENRLFAATREPIAGFLIYGIAVAIVEKWFTINDLATKGADPELDNSIQKLLRKLKYKRVLGKLVEYERLYGKSLLVGSFNDAANLLELANEKGVGADLEQLVAYPKISYSIFSKDDNPTSFRYGLPLTYQVNNGTQSFKVHWTRCFELQTRTNGTSVLDLIWDDLTCGRNIRWGVGQWIYRAGGGFAVIKFPKEIAGVPTTKEKLTAWANSKEWSNITHRTSICILEGMEFDFKGAQGAALNPEPFFDTNTKQISKATGYPKSVLEGAEAGALTGSEKNDQQFYKQISGEQSKLEDCNRWVIDQVLNQTDVTGIQTGYNSPSNSMTQTLQIDAKPRSMGSVLRRILHKAVPSVVKDQPEPQTIDYEIVWNNAFELNAVDEAKADLINEQANQTRLQYKTIDEVRGDNNLLPLPLGEGEVVLSLVKQSSSQFPSNPSGITASNPIGKLDVDSDESQLPTMRNLLKPILKQVFLGHMSHDIAVGQGMALIEFYNNTEKERALEHVRGKFQNPTLSISPEQEQGFTDQKTRFTKDFMGILAEAEKLAKKTQP
jgi:hypothetical protein